MSDALEEVDKIMEKGRELLNKAQPALAARFFLKALEKRSEDTSIMDTLADCFLSTGDARSALPLIERSIELAPESSPYKYLNMAQLEQGQEALSSYQTAIRVFAKINAHDGSSLVKNPSTVFSMEVADGIEDEGSKERKTNKEVAKAYCGIAELYLTDLCDEEDAEHQCESALKSALEFDEHNLDAKQTLASMRISQCNLAEASSIIAKVHNEVYSAVRDAQNKPIIDMVSEGSENESSNDGKDLPDPAFCLQTCKLMIECAPEDRSLAVKALDLLELLLNHNDEDPELWYVLALGALGCEPRDVDQAKDALEKSRALVEAAIERIEEGDEEEEGEGEEMDWQSYLDLIDQQLSSLEIEEDGDQWEDVEDDDEDEDDEG